MMSYREALTKLSDIIFERLYADYLGGGSAIFYGVEPEYATGLAVVYDLYEAYVREDLKMEIEARRVERLGK